MKQIIMTWDDFAEKYKPIQNTVTNRDEFNGWLFETYGEDNLHIGKLTKESPNNVWTLLDVDGDLVIVSGWHYVNRLGYFVSEIPFDIEESIIIQDND